MSEIRANTISDAAGTGPVTLTGQAASKHWVRFNGTGTPAVVESLNTSSITDRNTGLFTVNLTSAMSNANYSLVVHGNGNASTTTWGGTSGSSAVAINRTASAYYHNNYPGSYIDPVYADGITMGDLA